MEWLEPANTGSRHKSELESIVTGQESDISPFLPDLDLDGTPARRQPSSYRDQLVDW